jgi:hypothetical protein
VRDSLAYSWLVIRRAIEDTRSFTIRQGVVTAAFAAIFGTAIYSRVEDEVDVTPILVGSLVGLGVLVVGWFLLQLVMAPVRIHREQLWEIDLLSARIEELERQADITPRFGYREVNGATVLRLSLEYRAKKDLDRSLMNVRVPKWLAVFRHSNPDGGDFPLGVVVIDGDEKIWVNPNVHLRANADNQVFFNIGQMRGEKLPIEVAIVHTDLPQGSWNVKATVPIVLPVADSASGESNAPE